MTETTTGYGTGDQTGASGEERGDLLQKMTRALDGWRSKIDELNLQLELADLDVRDVAAKQVAVTQNVYLAARSRLSNARLDANSNVNTLRLGIEQLLADLRDAYTSAEAVVRRSREQ